MRKHALEGTPLKGVVGQLLLKRLGVSHMNLTEHLSRNQE